MDDLSKMFHINIFCGSCVKKCGKFHAPCLLRRMLLGRCRVPSGVLIFQHVCGLFGENWHLCIDRKCVRLNPRGQRGVSAKGCKQTARKREDRGDIERTVAPVAPLK